jgi:Mlc titration factor MtfA (ptsG expression regulator)
LNSFEKERFTDRLHKFIESKTFYIHDESGFREMPILTSASAIQVSFGLDKYLLPAYPHIHIYPEEFLRTHPHICFLEGSVSGYSIYLSWKHFLKGSNVAADGQHVGLHEMAHAYYCQNFQQRLNVDTNFKDKFESFNTHGKTIFESEQKPGNDFYTDYALRDLHEFWAESIENYFERPVEMKVYFPDLYAAMCNLLNQDQAKRVAAGS